RPFLSAVRSQGGARARRWQAQRLHKGGAMALFRSPRGEAPAPPEPVVPAGPPPASASEALATRLHEIAAAAGAPEEALEPALHAILEAARAQAGALCLYDVRNSVLRLTAESGLSDEGCRRLRNVRRSDPTAWDMPLQG